MSTQVFTNVRLINPCAANDFIENGYIAVTGEKISGIGVGQPEFPAEWQVIDLAGKSVLPGMVNAHTHLYSALALGMPWPVKTPQNFVQKLEKIWWKLDRALDYDSIRASFETGLMACLEAGVTTVIDHHSSQTAINGSLPILAEVAQELDMTVSTAFEISDRNGAEGFEAGLNENLEFYCSYHGHENIRPLIGLHASFTLEDESLQKIRQSVNDLPDWGIHIHVAEDQADEADARQRGYRSVIDRLDHFGLINRHSLIIHGLHTNNEDIDILRQKGAMLVHNPTSNANNRVGWLASEKIDSLQAGLGTDGMQGNMLKEAKEGTLIRSAHLPGGVDNVDYLRLLFLNNPRIAERLYGRMIGKLEVGQRADLAIYDYYPRTAITNDNYSGHLLFGLGSPSDVMTAGKFKIRDSKWVDEKQKQKLKNGQDQSNKLWSKIQEL